MLRSRQTSSGAATWTSGHVSGGAGERGRGEGEGAGYNAARRLQRFRFAEELVPEALDVVQAVGDHEVVGAEQPLHGGVLGCARLLLGAGVAVGRARDVQRLGVDEVQPQSGGGGGGRGGGDLRGEEGLQLARAGGLAGAGVAGDYYELRDGLACGQAGGAGWAGGRRGFTHRHRGGDDGERAAGGGR